MAFRSKSRDCGIYAYWDPGELRIDAEAEAMLTSHVKTGGVAQDLAIDGVVSLRSVEQPDAPPANASATVQDGAACTYVGSENIYQPRRSPSRVRRSAHSVERQP